jgi:hypothetical protein
MTMGLPQAICGTQVDLVEVQKPANSNFRLNIPMVDVFAHTIKSMVLK